MIGVIALGLSILVLLGGLLLLAKTKKDSLGNLYIFSSYSAIVLGTLLFVGTIVGGVFMMKCHHGKGNSSCYVKGHGSSCGQSAGCAKFSSSCNSHKKACCAHSKYGSESSYSHHGNKSSYKHGAKSKGSHHGDKKLHKHHDEDVDENNAKVEVEVEEVN